MDIMELLKDVLQMIIYAVITGCGIVVVKKVLDFMNKKIDEVQATTKLAEYDKLNKLIDQSQQIISDIVISVNQTFTETLKREGKFDKESAEIAKNTAVDKAKELLTEEAISAIEQVHGSADMFIDTMIESTVNQLKQNK